MKRRKIWCGLLGGREELETKKESQWSIIKGIYQKVNVRLTWLDTLYL